MKNFFLFVTFILSLTAEAQQFRRYQVKSGKIEYQLIRYITHTTMHTGTDGKTTGTSEQIPYVSEIRDYYWDNYGDVSRDVFYKVSDGGGKLLPEKKKTLERLWRDGRMYYLKNGKVAFDPDHLREACWANKPLFHKWGWFKVLYPDAKVIGKEVVAGKEGTRYYVDAFSEKVLWKGLVLRDVGYYTNGAGERKGKQWDKKAVKVQTGIDFTPGFFYPLWYQQFTPYYLLDAGRIGGLLKGNPELLEKAGPYGIILRQGETVVYVTSGNHLGKLSVLAIDPKNNNRLVLKYVTYNSDGHPKSSLEKLVVDNGFYCDLDTGKVSAKPFAGQDFQWKGKPFSILQQGKTLGFYLIKSSKKQQGTN